MPRRRTTVPRRRTAMSLRRTTMFRRWATMPRGRTAMFRRRTTMPRGRTAMFRRRTTMFRRWATMPRGRTTMSRRGPPMRRRMMLPMRFVVIPRASPVIAAPIRTDRKRDDRQTNRRAIGQKRHIAALIRIVEVTRIDPAALILQRNVAPRIATHAPHHRNRCAARQLRDNGVILRRSCIKIHRAIGIRLRLRRHHTRHDQQPGSASQQSADYSFLHRPSRVVEASSRPAWHGSRAWANSVPCGSKTCS
jgi:hypothetical protein